MFFFCLNYVPFQTQKDCFGRFNARAHRKIVLADLMFERAKRGFKTEISISIVIVHRQ